MIDYSSVPHRMELFGGQVNSACGLGAWCFSVEKKLFYTTFPNEKEFLMFLNISGCLDYIIENIHETKKPCILGDDLGLIWIADGYWIKDEIELLFVLGPIFLSNISLKDIQVTLENMNFNQGERRNLIQILQKVPVLSFSMMNQYASMLHYTITRENISIKDFHYQKALKKKPMTHVDNKERIPESEKFHVLEEAYLQCVREGNLNYHQFYLKETKNTDTESFHEFPIREMKNTYIIFVSLCSRAAVEGGLSPKVAKKMEGYYINLIERTANRGELSNIQSKMLDDFVKRVNQLKSNPHISQPVQNAINFIQGNLTQDMDLSDIAKKVGYTKYYFTKKFYNEMNVSLTDYIKEARINHAKILLITTDRSIQEISDEFKFSTRAYFSKIFREIVGMTPAAYRDKMKEYRGHEREKDNET